MKTFNYVLFIVILSVCASKTQLFAQKSQKLPVVAVLQIDSKGFTLDPVQMGNITRKELSKLNVLEVMDYYDVAYLLEKHEIHADNCFGKLCLLEIGKKIKTDKMLSGSVEVYEETIIVTFRLIDVGTSIVEKTIVREYLNLRQQVQKMIELSLRSMFEMDIDQGVLTKLTKKYDYANAINNPETERLKLSGPRMGMTLFTGTLANQMSKMEHEGGYDLFPLMFQMGYQFEVKYLNQGDFQALFEFIPMLTGLDQGKFIPSLSILNGMRSNRTGWEFAFGPNLYMSKVANGYNINGVWTLEEEAVFDTGEEIPVLESRVDSRGINTFQTRFVFAVGKTFKSGTLNIPINAFFIPHKDGHRLGISVGYNASRN